VGPFCFGGRDYPVELSHAELDEYDRRWLVIRFGIFAAES
jgi:hypothetical protein